MILQGHSYLAIAIKIRLAMVQYQEHYYCCCKELDCSQLLLLLRKMDSQLITVAVITAPIVITAMLVDFLDNYSLHAVDYD